MALVTDNFLHPRTGLSGDASRLSSLVDVINFPAANTAVLHHMTIGKICHLEISSSCLTNSLSYFQVHSIAKTDTTTENSMSQPGVSQYRCLHDPRSLCTVQVSTIVSAITSIVLLLESTKEALGSVVTSG